METIRLLRTKEDSQVPFYRLSNDLTEIYLFICLLVFVNWWNWSLKSGCNLAYYSCLSSLQSFVCPEFTRRSSLHIRGTGLGCILSLLINPLYSGFKWDRLFARSGSTLVELDTFTSDQLFVTLLTTRFKRLLFQAVIFKNWHCSQLLTYEYDRFTL